MKILERFKKIINSEKRRFFLLAYKRINISSFTLKTIEVHRCNVSYFPLSFNTILIVKEKGQIFYFRECRKHTDFKTFIDELFDEFYVIANKGYSNDNFLQAVPFRTSYTNKEISSFKKELEKCKKERFYKRILDIDYYLKKEGFALWQNKIDLSNDTLDRLDLYKVSLINKALFAYFLSFINSAIISYKFHSFVGHEEYETFNASRSIASYIVAKALGLERLITPSYLVKLSIDGQVKIGVLCNKADGVRALDAEFEITPSLQKELNNLQLLDVICSQYDHFSNNYNITNGGTDYAGVCAFDNDMNKTFLPFPVISFKPYYNGSPYIKHGYINRPYMDKNTVESVFNININHLKKELVPYLTKLQLWSLEWRIRMIRKAISNSIKKNSLCLLGDSDWSTNTIEEELSGKYGQSYLVLYKRRKIINRSYLNNK